MLVSLPMFVVLVYTVGFSFKQCPAFVCNVCIEFFGENVGTDEGGEGGDGGVVNNRCKNRPFGAVESPLGPEFPEEDPGDVGSPYPFVNLRRNFPAPVRRGPQILHIS